MGTAQLIIQYDGTIAAHGNAVIGHDQRFLLSLERLLLGDGQQKDVHQRGFGRKAGLHVGSKDGNNLASVQGHVQGRSC